MKEAQEEIIFYIENNKVESENLYDFVMRSVDETTSPVGVMPRLHIRHEDYSCYYNRRNRVLNDKGLYEVWTWGIRGNNPRFIQEFETEDEAEEFIFQKTYEFDFLPDDQRDTCYYHTYEEAEEEMIMLFADNNYISVEVAKSIFKHKKCAEQIIEDREQKKIENAKIERKRVERIAVEYANMIDKVEGENYRETAARLSLKIGQKIESKVFHKAVKIIRNK